MKREFRLAALAAMIAISGCTTGQKEEPLANDTNTITLADNRTTVTWIKDNQGDKLMPRELFPEASDSLMQALGVADGVPASISAYLMHCDGQWVLFDTGLGADKGGQLLNALQAVGLTPDSIGYIYLTHFHGDHIGGMMQNGQALFTRAEVFACCHEYMAWMMEMPLEKTELQRKVMEAYRDHTHLFEWGDSLPNGVLAIHAPGHTPGHTVFRKENLLIVGDLMHGFDLQLNHRYISCNYDMDKAQAAQSRNHILSIAHNEHLTICGMHLPAPAFFEVNPKK